MKSSKSDTRKVLKRIMDNKAIYLDKDNMVRADVTCEYVWQTLGRDGRHEKRQEWLTASKWDPGGWVFLNWRQLPRQLKYDLCMVGLETIEQIVLGKKLEGYETPSKQFLPKPFSVLHTKERIEP